MRLYTTLSEAEADLAERGGLYGEFVWSDRPQIARVVADAVQVSIEVPDNRLPRFETRASARLDHREFLLPSRITNLHKASRVTHPG